MLLNPYRFGVATMSSWVEYLLSLNPVVYYRMEEKSGTTAEDYGSANLPISVIGSDTATAGAVQYEQGLAVSGPGNGFRLNSGTYNLALRRNDSAALNIAGNMTVLIWYKPNVALSGNYPKIFWKPANNPAGGQGNFIIQVDNVGANKFNGRVTIGGTNYTCVGALTPTVGNEYLLILRRNGTTLDLWENQNKSSSIAIPGGALETSGGYPLYIGGYNTGDGNDRGHGNGTFNDFALFNYALSDAEILALWDRRNAALNYKSLVLAKTPIAYYRFDTSPGLTISEVNNAAKQLILTGSAPAIVAGLGAGTGDAASFSAVGYYRMTDSAAAPAFRTLANNFSVEWLSDNISTGNIMGGAAGAGQFQIRVNSAGLFIVKSGVVEVTGFVLLANMGDPHHCGITYDNLGFVCWYIDGALNTKQYIGATSFSGANDTLIAHSLSDIQLTGVLDDLALYNTVLTANDFKLDAIAAGFKPPAAPTYTATAALARAIYATRAVNGYAGNLVDVRRSSDNATMSVGVTASEMDTVALLAWAGSDSVYVSKWYDQSGNGHHLVQTTNGNQPRLVNAGTMEAQNAKPIINYLTGTYLCEAGAPFNILDNSDVTVLSVGLGQQFCRGEDGSGAGWSLRVYGTGHTTVVFAAAGAAAYSPPSSPGASTFKAMGTRLRNGGGGGVPGSSWYSNEFDGYMYGGTGNTTNYNFRSSTIGMQIGRGAAGANEPAKIGELLVWRQTLSGPQCIAVHDSMKIRYAV